MDANIHLKERETVKWGSYGKLGDKPIRWTLVKDLSDSHLMRIVEHLTQRKAVNYLPDPYTLDLMKTEVTYRTNKFIFIEDYYD